MARTHLLVLVASTRPGRLGPTVAAWFAEQARRRDTVAVATVDLAAMRVRSDDFAAAVAAAEAVVVVTPEYNHSFPGPLKTAIDSLQQEWFAKPVAFVSYGGISGGLRAVEALRLVFAELHAVTVRETVSFAQSADRFGPSGLLGDPVPAEAAADRLLDQLEWWADATRTAKSRRAYVS